MIASLSSQVAQAVATVGGFETDIEDINSDIDTINTALDTKDGEIYLINQTLTNHLNSINANNTKNAQQDTRLTALFYANFASRFFLIARMKSCELTAVVSVPGTTRPTRSFVIIP